MKTPTMTSNIRRLCENKGWTKEEFVGYMLAKAGIREKTARKIYDGETGLRVDTAAKVAVLLGVGSLGDLIELKSAAKKQAES